MRSLENTIGCGKLFLKDESQRFGIGAFKALGASWAVHQLISNNPEKEVFCTATDGNHGRAVAWSCRIMQRKAVIFMPSHTVKARQKWILDEGASLVLVDGDYDQTVKVASKFASDNDAVLVQDTSWPGYVKIPQTVAAGYLTMSYELTGQFFNSGEPFPDFVILQSGVGSWAASMMLSLTNYLKGNAPGFITVEPYHSDCLLESAKKGKLSPSRKSLETIMAGLNCGTPSMKAWEILQDLTTAFMSVSDEWAVKAMRLLNKPGEEDPQIKSCESGAAGLAGLMAIYSCKELDQLRKDLGINGNTRFLIINSEGITDPDSWKKITGSDYCSDDDA